MIKKISVTLMLIVSLVVQGQLTLESTSTINPWTPTSISNSGLLSWVVSGGITDSAIDNNQPSFDMGSNSGIALMTITDNNSFTGLTNFSLPDLDISSVDVSDAIALEDLNLRSNQITSIDISQNTNLKTLLLHRNSLNAIDISQNTELTDVNLSRNRLLHSDLDNVVIQLDNNAKLGGNLTIVGNVGYLSYASYNAYNSLIGKGWVIDVDAPPSGPIIEEISVVTDSNVSNWRFGRIRNTGLTFHYKAEGPGIAMQEFDENNPTFDFSSNSNNDPITITITSDDGFNHFEEMSLYIGDGTTNNSGISQIDIQNAEFLRHLYPFKSKLLDIDVSSNTELIRLLIHDLTDNEKQLINQTNDFLDVSNNSKLYYLRVNSTYVTSLSSLLNNKLIVDLDLRNSEFTSASLDQVLIDLDKNNIVNPPSPQIDPNHIKLIGNPGNLTSASYTAYNSLISKGWMIDLPSPTAPLGSDINITGLGIDIPGNGTNTPSTTDDTDFGQTASGTPITKQFTIENLGDQPLDLTDNPDLVAISGANASEFTISVLPTTPVAVGANTTFDVTFNANSLGVRTAILTIESNDIDESTYVFNIQAESTQAVGPEINVTSNSVSIPNNNTPIVTDNTDFGQVQIGSPVTHTFTIENLGDSDLTITSSDVYNSDFSANTTDFSMTTGKIPPPSGFPPSPSTVVLSPGSSHIFEVTFDTQIIGDQTAIVGIVSDDTDEDSYIINLTAEGIAASSGTIGVQGGNPPISIVGDGNNTPTPADGTDYGQAVINTVVPHTFTIINTGLGDLILNSVSLVFNSSGYFSISSPPGQTVLPSNASTTFTVDFNPVVVGNYSAVVQIDNSDTTQNPFQYQIVGEGIPTPPVQDIMISQYYSGSTTGNDRWIEVMNISNNTIPANTYHLVLFDQSQARIGVIETAVPDPTTITTINVDMNPGDVILYRNAGATLPTSANLGQTPVRC